MGELIQGDSGNNNLVGTSGDDTLNGLGGIDTLSGGAGNDVYYVDNAKDVLIENPDCGNDVVYFSDQSQNSTFVLPDNVEHLILQPGSANGTGNARKHSFLIDICVPNRRGAHAVLQAFSVGGDFGTFRQTNIHRPHP